MAEYRIDELARLADTTVRNVRVYQDRGLLSPPRREGRVGIYTEAHLARLRLIGQLLKRGYTFANIGELVSVWERGGNLTDVLGLESAVGDPWSDEIPGHITMAELRETFPGQVTPAALARALQAGLIVREGDRFRVPSPRLLHAGAELVRAGIPLRTVLDISDQLQDRIDTAARDLVGTVSEHIVATHAPDGMVKGEEIAEVAALTRRLRPLAQLAVDAMLAQSMARYLHSAVGEHFAEVLEHMRDESDDETDANTSTTTATGEAEPGTGPDREGLPA